MPLMVTAEGKVTSGRTNGLTTGSLDVAQALVIPESLVRLRELLDSRPFTLRAVAAQAGLKEHVLALQAGAGGRPGGVAGPAECVGSQVCNALRLRDGC